MIPLQLTQSNSINSFLESTIIMAYANNPKIEVPTQHLVEKKEELETKKRILTKYIDYILNNNLTYLINSFNHLRDISTQFNSAYTQEQLLKSKLASIKKHYILSSSKIIINKAKRKTLLSIHSNLIQLFKWHQEYIIFTNAHIKSIKSFKEITSLITDISKGTFSYHSIICNKISQSLQSYQNHLDANYEEDTIASFLKFNHNINSLFTDFILVKCKQDISSFILSCFKKSIFRTFKGTLLAYSNTSDDSVIINSATGIKHMKDLALVSFDEKRLFSALKCLWPNITIIIQNYNAYITKTKCSIIVNGNDKGITNFFDFNKELFAEVLQNKLIKLMLMLDNCITSFTHKQNIYQILSSIVIIGIIIQKGFCLERYPEKIMSLFNDLVKKALRSECRNNIKRIGVFLNADLWKRNMIKNINE